MTAVPGARSAAGFTLLEILAALAILGLVLGALTLGIRFGLAAVATGGRVTDNTAEFEVVDRTVRHLIEGMDPGHDPDPAPFIGRADGLQCVTRMPADSVTPDRQMRASLFVDGGHRLVLRWRPYLRAMPLRPPPQQDAELLSNVRRIDVAFWQPGDGWVTVWRASYLPVLVRVRLSFPAGDRRRWPDIVAAPQMDRP